MSTLIKYPHIDQFRTVIKQVSDTFRYNGKDENGDPIYDKYKELPTIKFIGTTKIHGTNCSVGFMNDMTYWCQSREELSLLTTITMDLQNL